jgi:hypothetical protein
MVRTQIQLTEEQSRELDRLAGKRGVSKAALIRSSVDMMLALTKSPDDAEVRERAIRAAGRLHSGTGDLASRHDDYAVEAYSQ